MLTQGYKALVKAQGSSTVFTDEATTTVDDQVYTITDTAKGVWTLDDVVVKVDAVQTTENFTLQRLAIGGATVTFENVDALRGVVTVSGKYITLTTIATANSITFNATLDTTDITAFSEDTKSFQGTLLSGTVELGRFYQTDDFFVNEILNKEIKVIEYYTDATGDPFRFFVVPTTNAVNADVAEVITETMSYQITNEISI